MEPIITLQHMILAVLKVEIARTKNYKINKINLSEEILKTFIVGPTVIYI